MRPPPEAGVPRRRFSGAPRSTEAPVAIVGGRASSRPAPVSTRVMRQPSSAPRPTHGAHDDVCGRSVPREPMGFQVVRAKGGFLGSELATDPPVPIAHGSRCVRTGDSVPGVCAIDRAAIADARLARRLGDLEGERTPPIIDATINAMDTTNTIAMERPIAAAKRNTGMMRGSRSVITFSITSIVHLKCREASKSVGRFRTSRHHMSRPTNNRLSPRCFHWQAKCLGKPSMGLELASGPVVDRHHHTGSSR